MMSHLPASARVGRLPGFQRISACLVLTLCAFSGATYVAGHELDLWRDWLGNRNVLITHGISAYLVLILIGSVLPAHVRAAWRARKNLVTGLIMLAVMLILAVSGLLLYYGPEELRDATLWTHWVVGMSVFLVFPLHALTRWKRPA